MNRKAKQSILTFTNEEGKELKCKILFEIEMNDKKYIIYTDDSTDENGQIRAFASYYKPDDDSKELFSINTEKEWNMIEKFMASMVSKNIKE